jgi:hypothetical protein
MADRLGERRLADPRLATDQHEAAMPAHRGSESLREDALWPSTRLSQIAMDRLMQYHHPYPNKHLHYAGAGHSIAQPYSPTTGRASGYVAARKRTVSYGGNAQGYAHADADSWPQVISRLQTTLGK